MSRTYLSLTDLAAGLAAAQRAEEHVFAVVGRWVRAVPEPEAKVLLSAHSRRHGDHAVAVGAVAPRPAAAAPARPGPVLGPALLDVLDGLETTTGRLAALSRVLLPMVVEATDLAAGPRWAAAPVARALQQVAADHREQAAEVEALLARTAARAADAAAVERDLAALGLATGQELRIPASNQPEG